MKIFGIGVHKLSHVIVETENNSGIKGSLGYEPEKKHPIQLINWILYTLKEGHWKVMCVFKSGENWGKTFETLYRNIISV